MNAKEVVRALREDFTCLDCERTEECNGEPDCLWREEAADLIESLQAQLKDASQRGLYYMEQLEESRRREKAAVEMLTKLLKHPSDDICEYCKNEIKCLGEIGCDSFMKGTGATGSDGVEHPNFKWSCMDFEYGTCEKMTGTPCEGCFESDYDRFEWRGPREEATNE